MNIVEAYIKFKPGLVILISGISGAGTATLAKQISKDFKINLISYKDFLDESYNRVETINYNDKNIEIKNWDSDDAINWDKFIQAIKNAQSTGVVAFSPSFPQSKIDFADFHINIKLSKQNLLHRRLGYQSNNNTNNNKNQDETIDKELQTLLFNKFTYPYYLQTTSDAKITKFINANEYAQLPSKEYNDKVYDDVFDYLIKMIQDWLDNYSKKH